MPQPTHSGQQSMPACEGAQLTSLTGTSLAFSTANQYGFYVSCASPAAITTVARCKNNAVLRLPALLPHSPASTRAPACPSGSGQRTLGRACQPTPEVTRREETSEELQLANCHMPWQSYRQQRRAQGVLLSLAPHPAVEETHLAPCWTFIRSDLHQMVGVFWHWCRLVRCWRCGHISPRQGSPDWSGSSSTDAKTAAVAVTKAAWLGAIFYAGRSQP